MLLEETNVGSRRSIRKLINRGDSASGHYDTIYQKQVRQEKKQA